MNYAVVKLTFCLTGTLLIFISGFGQFSYESNTINKRIQPKNEMEYEANSERKKFDIEVSHGQAFDDWTDSWLWMFRGNFLVRFNNKIAIGGGTGLQFDWTGLYPVVSATSVYGNKSESLATGIDLLWMFTQIIDQTYERLWVTFNLYYKDFFIKIMPTFIAGYEKQWVLELGYSFTINR